MDRKRFSGCLIGQCLGDALGFPVEGFPAELCRVYVDEALRGPEGLARRRAGLPTGQYTDDSQLARELLQSFAARGCFDPEDYARRIAAIFVEERIVGRGLATHRAALRIAHGIPGPRPASRHRWPGTAARCALDRSAFSFTTIASGSCGRLTTRGA